jgi:dienelactone hydrolase
MKQLFYFIIFLSLAAVSCNIGDKGELSTVASDVELGKAGTISIKPEGGLELTADYYPNKSAKKIIILFHQADYSRGEYKNIAPRLVKEGFACLAVDLRSGGLVNEIFNETAKRAKEQNLKTDYLDAKADMRAAINYVAENTDKDIYIWGSSYSAGLALIVGRDERVKRVVAFSPGEYFETPDFLKEEAAALNKPTFITGGVAEYDNVVMPIVNVMLPQQVTAHRPSGMSDHGSKALDINSSTTDETWSRLLGFLKK